MTWLVVAALALLMALALVWPMVRPTGAVTVRQKRALLLARFEQEKATLAADRDAGVMDAGQVDDVLAELERRIVRDLDAMETSGLSMQARPVMAVAVLVAIFSGAMGLYAWLGNPHMPETLVTHQARQAARVALEAEVAARQQEVQAAIVRLIPYVAENPDDLEAALTLGRAHGLMGNYGAAAVVLQQALEHHEGQNREGQNREGQERKGVADMHALLAEAMILDKDGTIGPEAMQHIDRALALDATQDTALYYQGWFLVQSAQVPEAVRVWRHLLDIAPENAPYRPDLQRRVAAMAQTLENRVAVAPKLSEADMQAAEDMSETDRAAFIESMVGRLAAHLEENPDDLTGWMRLGRAYEVLGRPAEAARAYHSALKVQTDFEPALSRLQFLEALTE